MRELVQVAHCHELSNSGVQRVDVGVGGRGTGQARPQHSSHGYRARPRLQGGQHRVQVTGVLVEDVAAFLQLFGSVGKFAWTQKDWSI